MQSQAPNARWSSEHWGYPRGGTRVGNGFKLWYVQMAPFQAKIEFATEFFEGLETNIFVEKWDQISPHAGIRSGFSLSSVGLLIWGICFENVISASQTVQDNSKRPRSWSWFSQTSASSFIFGLSILVSFTILKKDITFSCRVPMGIWARDIANEPTLGENKDPPTRNFFSLWAHW